MHQAILSRQFISSLKSQRGIICPDCKQEIAHVCPSHPSIASSSLQQPTTRYELHASSTLSNPAGSLQQRPFQGNHVLAQAPSATQGNPPYNAPVSFNLTQSPQNNPVVSSTSISHSAQPYAPISFSPLAVSSNSGTSSSFPNPQWNLSSCLGKRGITGLDCESDSKKARWSGFQSYQRCSTSSTYPPTGEASETLPLTTISVRSGLHPHLVSKPLPITPEDRPSIRKRDIAENWSITYNQKVQKVVDVRPVRAFHVKRDFYVSCTKFSKDGKYLAVGFERNGITSVYDVQTGQKSWLVCRF